MCFSAADADLKRQQDEFKAQCDSLEAKINNPSTGQVAKGQAVQQLAALKGADPLPLRKAKITQEAAVRKVEAERKVAQAEREKATVVRKKAEEERRAAVAAREKAEEERAHAVAEREKAEAERKRLVEFSAYVLIVPCFSAEGERELAVAAREQAEEQTRRVEEAVADTERRAKEANDLLEEVAHLLRFRSSCLVFACS